MSRIRSSISCERMAATQRMLKMIRYMVRLTGDNILVLLFGKVDVEKWAFNVLVLCLYVVVKVLAISVDECFASERKKKKKNEKHPFVPTKKVGVFVFVTSRGSCQVLALIDCGLFCDCKCTKRMPSL